MIKRRIFAAVALLCALVVPAHAQKTKAQINTEITTQFPDNTTGAITPSILRLVTSDMVNSIMPTAPVVSGNLACFNGTTGLLQDCGTPPVTVGTLPIVVSGNTVSCPTCLTSAAPSAIVNSRALATTLNLSAFSAVTTLGYAAGGNGGGATFKNVSSSPFVDSYITTFTITAGSGYTNGSYFGVIWTNTTKPFAIGTATVAGGIVTAVSVAGTPGGLCHVGDVYTTGSITGGTGASLTVTGCSTQLGSFIDSVGTHFQIVYDGDSPNIRQFGAVGDYNFANPDSSATDNFNSIQAALWFAGFSNGFVGGGDFWGGKLWVPQGSFLACGAGSTSLIVPNGVTLEGASNQGSVVHMCDAFNTSTHFVTLCDSNWHFACFNSLARNIQFSAKPTVAMSGVTCMVYSNATQDMGGLYGVYIYAGGRCGVWLEKGYGGASTVHLDGLSITALSSAPQIRIGDTVGSGLNYGTTIVNMRNIILGGPSSGGTYQTGSGILLQGGFPSIENVHCEDMPICIEVTIPSGTGNGELVRIHNVNAGSGAPAPTCTGIIALDAANNSGNTIIGQVPAGSCTDVVQNGQSGGSNRTTPIALDVIFNP